MEYVNAIEVYHHHMPGWTVRVNVFIGPITSIVKGQDGLLHPHRPHKLVLTQHRGNLIERAELAGGRQGARKLAERLVYCGSMPLDEFLTAAGAEASRLHEDMVFVA